MYAHSKKQVFKILKTEKSNDRTVWPCKGFSKGITSHFSLHDEYRNKQQNKTLIHTLFSALLSTLLLPVPWVSNRFLWHFQVPYSCLNHDFVVPLWHPWSVWSSLTKVPTTKCPHCYNNVSLLSITKVDLIMQSSTELSIHN